MTTTTKTLVALLVAGLAGMMIFLIVSMSGGGTAAAKTCQLGHRDCLPDVTYTDTDGTAYQPKDLAGKVVIVNFWATWCKPCLKEIPDLSQVFNRYKDRGVVMLGVMTDDLDNQALLNFTSDRMMSYPVVRASSDILLSYNHPRALPTTFIYDRRGKLVSRTEGPLEGAALERVLDRLLAN